MNEDVTGQTTKHLVWLVCGETGKKGSQCTLEATSAPIVAAVAQKRQMWTLAGKHHVPVGGQSFFMCAFEMFPHPR